MTPCPRCRHPAVEVPSVCTQCGFSIPAPSADPRPVRLGKFFAGVLAVVLLLILVGVAVVYLQEIGRLVR